ncbi:Uncharacterized protein FKW44_005261, partial [Caligus rogercresseyi]
DFETALLETYDQMLAASKSIPRFEYVLDPPDEDEKPEYLKPIILQDIIDAFKRNVNRIIQKQSERPSEYTSNFDSYLYLVDGRADVEIQDYVKESHSFNDLVKKIKFFDNL